MATCASLIRGRRMRVTRLDSCGRPVYSQESQVVTSGFIQVEVSPEVEEAEDNTTLNAAGEVCVADPGGCDQLKWYELEMEFCQVDPTLVQIINPSWDLVRNPAGEVVGVRGKNRLSCETGYALELWTDVAGAGADACTGAPGSQGLWGYLLYPWVVGGVPGDLTIENGAISFTFTGKSKSGGGWRRGPYKVTLDAAGMPGPLLTPIGPEDSHHLELVQVRPPAPKCGAQPVPRPTPEPAEVFLEAQSTDPNRRTLRLRANNHGFGPLVVTWGDGTAPEEVRDGQWVTHAFAADGTFTVRVADKQTPLIFVERTVTVPLPPDTPTITVTANPNSRMQVVLRGDSHGYGALDVNWGDDTTHRIPPEQANGQTDVAHDYALPGIYTITVSRTDLPNHAARFEVAVPIPPAPTVTGPTQGDTDHTALITIDNTAAKGGVNVNWGDGTDVEAAPESVPDLPHVYATEGTFQIRVEAQVNPLAATTKPVTIPFAAPFGGQTAAGGAEVAPTATPEDSGTASEGEEA